MPPTLIAVQKDPGASSWELINIGIAGLFLGWVGTAVRVIFGGKAMVEADCLISVPPPLPPFHETS